VKDEWERSIMIGIMGQVAVALMTYLGKKTIDNFWGARSGPDNPIITQNGNLGFTSSHEGRTLVGREFIVDEYQEVELIFGNLYLPEPLSEYLYGDEIALVLIVEEIEPEAVLFEADLDYGYEIYLPHGIYSFYVFVVDPDLDDLFDAEIYAIGLPSSLDLSGVEELTLEDADDIWEYLIDSPIPVSEGGPYYLDFILLDTDEVPEFPKSFSEL
jgi:hypothetical protein